MAITKQKKEDVLQKLVANFKDSKSVVFSQYSGVNVKDMSKLRNELRESGVRYTVAKKTLLKLAAKEAGLGELSDELIEGPVATAFSLEDEVAAAKILHKFSKEIEGLQLSGGLLEGEFFGKDKAMMLAQIPGKEELIGKFMGSLQAPVQGLHGVMSAVMRSFVGTLQAVVDQGGVTEEAEAPATAEEESPATDEAPKEEAEAPAETEEAAAEAESTEENAEESQEEAA
jgi:large subunit ribosomal protein L10